MHLAYTTTGPVAYTTTPPADTFCPKEFADLREVVAATHLGGPLLPTVQAAVVHAKMVRDETWTAEAQHLLALFDAAPVATPAPMVATRLLEAPATPASLVAAW